MQFVVKQTGVITGKQGCQGQFKFGGREASVGQIRADEGVVPRSRQLWSRGRCGSEPGRRRRGSRQ